MDWEKRCILRSYLKLPFFAPFSFQGAQCCKCPNRDKKKETRGGILAQFPPCLDHVTSLSPGTLRALRCSTAAAQLLTLWLHEGKCEQKAVENGREIMDMNTSIFQEDSTANEN